jgi:CBS domain-containing protein/anti-sigma regulatory factor (Ser/Thr protein kinase)
MAAMKRNKLNADSAPDKKKKKRTSAESDRLELARVQELVYELKVRDAMIQNVITVTADTSMRQLREVLRSNRISGTPVVKDDELVGVISVEDLVNWLTEGSEDCPVKDRMTANVDVVCADEPLIHAVSELDKSGFRRLPVIERKNKKLVGVITRDCIIENLLYKLEIDYREEEIRRYRASHIFEDIVGDNVALTFQSHVVPKDFDHAGTASSGLKKTLNRLGIHPQIVRRAAIASYEAEMNLAIYSDGGTITTAVQAGKIDIDVKDTGPGITDIEKAMQPGFSTAEDWVRELGFGAGMGLTNIKKCADRMDLASELGKGTHLKIGIDIKDTNTKSKTG